LKLIELPTQKHAKQVGNQKRTENKTHCSLICAGIVFSFFLVWRRFRKKKNYMRKKTPLLRSRLLWSIFGPKTCLPQMSPRHESVLRHVPCRRVLSKTNLDVERNLLELNHSMTHTWFVTHGTVPQSSAFARRPISTVFSLFFCERKEVSKRTWKDTNTENWLTPPKTEQSICSVISSVSTFCLIRTF